MQQTSQLHQTADSHHQAHHVIAVKTYVTIYVVLMVLLAATVGVHFMDLGAVALPIAMAIAMVKAVLIVLFFMHVYYSAPLTWAVASGSLLWLALFLAFLVADYAGRGWLDIPGK
ncbi:cytochrome C oxidase subunit IV family protein [Planctomyces sp. SH-PL62]|uniref:cytochrome C oxidase subunit IV family protein n=1 Tax=Planctomyces sp. SH-PL62 TaxID=1636152 RepID=UPI00078B876F|nr:cytochrome C oxidase subunit IV family protein [Planctomyces sp. SH-PL62]AMV40902.1 hypothetical protein VT85_25940 [Planctomyces sp. SH-PL62]